MSFRPLTGNGIFNNGNGDGYQRDCQMSPVSVPSRGTGFLISSSAPVRRFSAAVVSVPSRGTGFLIMNDFIADIIEESSFRPLTGNGIFNVL